MKVIYQGPSPSVDLPDLGIVAVAGSPVDVPDHIGDSLVAQGWKPVKTKAATKAATTSEED